MCDPCRMLLILRSSCLLFLVYSLMLYYLVLYFLMSIRKSYILIFCLSYMKYFSISFTLIWSISQFSSCWCYGRKYGTWRHADVRRRHADYSIQCVYINRVAVHFKKYEFGMNKNGFLIKWNFVSASLWKTWSWSHTV